LVARLASARPAPRTTLPASTTTRVPKRSLSAPQAKLPTPIARKFSVIAPEIAVRDQPVSCAMGWRNTASEKTAPMAMQPMRPPIATIVQA
jgi:hypothetical protein